MTTDVLYLRGPILRGLDDEAAEAWVVDGHLTYERPPARVSVTQVRGYVLPGLVDAHCHVGLETHGAVPPERAQEHAAADRAAGTLLIRDCGSPADTHWIDERDDLPRIIRAGRHIARTKRYLRNYAHEIEPEDLVAYVRQEARRGDGWVKLVGDWIDRDAGDLTPCWPREALAPAIDAAHAEGARVTAHCFGEQSLFDLAETGIDCIEHATGLTDESIALLAAKNVAIVPTLVNIANFPGFAAAGERKFPRYAAHMRDLHARRYETVARAHDAGVQIFAGTDAGGQLPHGLIAAEVAELTRAGLDVGAALGAATWSARRWLGCSGLEEGAAADLVVYADDPRRDVRTLHQPVAVVLRGRIVD